MPFNPDFMLKPEQFQRDRKKVLSLDEWKAFYKKWLDTKSWPKKSPDVRREEGKRKRGPVWLGGRLWGFTNFNYDISPEARYEYFFALRTVGGPLKFPDEVELAKTAENGFYQECPYCEIATDQIGEEDCPQCGRKLLYNRRAG